MHFEYWNETVIFTMYFNQFYYIAILYQVSANDEIYKYDRQQQQVNTCICLENLWSLFSLVKNIVNADTNIFFAQALHFIWLPATMGMKINSTKI